MLSLYMESTDSVIKADMSVKTQRTICHTTEKIKHYSSIGPMSVWYPIRPQLMY